MDLRSAARAAFARVILGAVIPGAVGCAVARPANVVRVVSPAKVTGANRTQTGGRAYLSWDTSQASAGPPRMVLARIDPRTGKIQATNTFSPGLVGEPLFADQARCG